MATERKEDVATVRELTLDELAEVSGGGGKETLIGAGVWLSDNVFKPIGQFSLVNFFEKLLTS